MRNNSALFYIPSIAILFLLLTGCSSKPDKLFTQLTEEETQLSFSNTITETEELNINQYLYAHNGGGVAVGDINKDGLPDIYLTANQLPNKLFLNKGNFQFEDITQKAGVEGTHGRGHWKTGVVMADVNADGLLDIYVSQVSNYRSFDGVNQLFINNGDLTFSEQSEAYGLNLKNYSQQAAFFDYDLDGDLDMYQLNHSVHNPDVYIKAEERVNRDSLAGDRLFRNDNGRFVDVSKMAGIYGGATGYGLAAAIGDIDNNGCPDVYVSNDFHENDYVYYNNCDGTFREGIVGTLGHSSTFSMGNDIADFNNDGLLDILSLDMKPQDEVWRKRSAGPDPFNIYNYKLSFGYFYQYPRNMLQLNRGNLFADNVQFSEIGQLVGIDATDWSWSGLMTDLDNDGRKDIFITNGIIRRPIDLDYINFTYNDEVHKNFSSMEMVHKMPEGAVKNYAYRNKGQLNFENVSAEWGLDLEGYSMGAAYADLDNDGDLDLIVNNLNAPVAVYRNNAESLTPHNYVKIKLEGQDKNPFGVGARVTIETAADTMMQELSPTRGWLSSMGYILNFGLGRENEIKKITIRWMDGRVEERTQLKGNQLFTFRQQDAVFIEEKNTSAPRLFRDATAAAGIDFKHQENYHIDFNYERLIPHSLSSEGPKMAIGDVNGDGLEDVFIGGAFGQSGALYLQQQQGATPFKRQLVEAFEVDEEREDIGATFFDADADGDLDLYVVSGGGQSLQSEFFQDRLYLNDGRGQFTKSSNSLPPMVANGSCVTAGDFNGDEAMDLFVGSRSIVGQYGLFPDSYILWNDGQGQFRKDTSSVLEKLGMVTDAVWLPEQQELAVVGEWMAITFLKMGDGSIQKRKLPNTGGWWNTIHVDDIDQDGDADLLLGNLGENTELKASKEEPLQLYVQDYDNNLIQEPILTYFNQGQEWIYQGLDEIKNQMPGIRVKYPRYIDFAQHTFSEVFPEQLIATAQKRKAQMLQSVYLINEGKGKYTIKEFPKAMQYSPVFAFSTGDFNEDGHQDILAVGNFYGATPAIGRFDASYGQYLEGDGQGHFTTVEPAESGFAVYGEARDMKLIQQGVKRWIIISRNNVPVRVLENIKNQIQ